MKLLARVAALAVAALVVAVAGAGSASAAPITIGSFPTWATTPSSTPGLTYEGTAAFAASAAFPSVTVTTDSTTVKTPSGDSAWLGDSTGFGAHFGSTRAQPYLYLSPAAGLTPSTTTLTFSGPPPAGWGLAVGDIDADFVEIIPRNAVGTVLPGSVLSAQDTTGTPRLNYCNNTPKPSTCAGPGPFTDAPFWFTNGTTIAGTTYTTPIVKGNGPDTYGAYDWFLPSTAVHSITLVFHVQSGFPIYQLWLASPAPVATITGTIATSDGSPVPPGTTIDLQNTDASPVLGLDNTPVTTAPAPDGSYSFETEQADYDLAFEVPAGYAPIPPISVSATSATVAAPAVVVAPAVAPPTATPTPTPTATPTPTSTPTATPNSTPSATTTVTSTESSTPVANAAQLPPTGSDPRPGIAASVLLLLTGVAALVMGRRARSR